MSTEFDIVIIGGGISGLGVALKAVEKGYNTALVEKGKIASATSANSLRIIHGGFRYLQSLDLQRVVESIRAKQEILKRYPDFVTDLPCLMPLNRFGLKSKYPVLAAGLIYSALSSFRSNVKVLDRKQAENTEVFLRNRVENGALKWNDALLHNPNGLIAKIVSDLQTEGVRIEEQIEAQQIEKNDSRYIVKLSNAESFKCKVVIETTGAWLKKDGVKWQRAFNVVLKRSLDINGGVGIVSKENRLYFLVKRDDVTAIGTGYLPFSGDPDNVTVSDAEIQEFISGIDCNLKQSDIAKVEVGIIPEELGLGTIYDTDGHIQILSTKYTTFLAQADRALKVADKYLQ